MSFYVMFLSFFFALTLPRGQGFPSHPPPLFLTSHHSPPTLTLLPLSPSSPFPPPPTGLKIFGVVAYLQFLNFILDICVQNSMNLIKKVNLDCILYFGDRLQKLDVLYVKRRDKVKILILAPEICNKSWRLRYQLVLIFKIACSLLHTQYQLNVIPCLLSIS